MTQITPGRWGLDKMSDKIRVLALGDYCCTTGFATVMSNIMQQLYATGKYEVDVVGINYDGDPKSPDFEQRFPGNVYPAVSAIRMQGNYGDVFGRQRFLDLLGSGNYDVVFILQDTFIVQEMTSAIQETYQQVEKKFKTIYYFPFDATPKKEWVEKVVTQFDFPVAYTEYAKALCVEVVPGLENKLEIIYHGSDEKSFFPIEDKEAVATFKDKYWAGKAEGRFVITNVNRNQTRKDIIRSLMILAELKKRGKTPLLYLHMQHDDQGGNILVMADHFGLKLGDDYIMPHPQAFSAHIGLPIEILNLIYNASDCLLTTTLGEGWGLSITEAMSTKLPVVAPDQTSMHEILADNRGYLVKAGANPSMWIMKEGDNERLRPLMDVEDAADKIELIMKGKLPDTNAALEWVKKYSWENVGKDWKRIFERAAIDARTASAVMPNRAQRRARK